MVLDVGRQTLTVTDTRNARPFRLGSSPLNVITQKADDRACTEKVVVVPLRAVDVDFGAICEGKP